MNIAEDVDGQSLVPIAVDTLCASAVLPFNLYLPSSRGGSLVLYRQCSYPFTQEDFDRLVERNVRTLYMQCGDVRIYHDHLRETILKNQEIPAARRYQVLREAARAVLSEAFSGGEVGDAVTATTNLGRDLVHTVCDSQVVLNDVLRVMAHDYGMFTHAINVATYCLLIARRMGTGSEQELLWIGRGALLHDIGKQYAPKKIFAKRERLSDREKQIIREHPTQGFLELCRREDLSWGELMMVYEHHERCDGRGYPVGLLRSEIHEYGRLCAIADVCDALMQDRPYRRAALQSDVVEYLDRQAGRAFDEEMSRCWIAAIKQAT
jgi:putative nucleotidyltransferase with HDIG domain